MRRIGACDFARGLLLLVLSTASCTARSAPATSPTPIPAFPGAGGYGAVTRGARGPCAGPIRVLTVNRLGDYGDGECDETCTLRDALMTEGPRFVNFDVSGTIRLSRGRLRLGPKQSCLTVSGATSPGGVTVANYAIEVNEGFTEGIFRYLKIRPAGPFIVADRGTLSGCNDYRRLCERREGERLRGTGPPDRDRPCLGDDGCHGRGLTGRCLAYERSEYEARSPCGACDVWKREHPDDFTGCNDVIIDGGHILDAFSFYPGVTRVVLDHMSLTWGCDLTIGMGATKTGADLAYLSITNNIIGNGKRSTDASPCHREQDHSLGVLLNVLMKNETPERIRQITFARNYFVHNLDRAPWIKGGQGEFVDNLVYGSGRNHVKVTSSANYFVWDFRNNVFRPGPRGVRHQGYCMPPDEPRACAHHGHCLGRCDESYDVFIAGRPSPDGVAPSLYLAGNRFLDRRGRDVTALPHPEFDDQWDRVDANRWRPLRRPVNEAAGDLEGTPTLWSRRRATPVEPRPRYPVDEVAATRLADAILPTVGASRPLRDAVDAALVESYIRGTDYIEGPYHYPATTGAPWSDADRDGMADAWERGVGLDPERDDALADPDADGYPNVEEWMNGTRPTSSDAPEGGRSDDAL